MFFEEKSFLPVILGSDITAYSLVRSFYQEYKVKPLVIHMSKNNYSVKSCFCDDFYVENLEKPEILLSTLEQVGSKYSNKKLILFGCGDWYVRCIIENKESLSKYYVIPYIDENLMNEIVLKDKFYEICEELDIPHPDTFVYDCKENTPLTFDFKYPVIAKNANSALYHYAKFPGKKKVFTFNNKEDLEKMLENVRTSSYDYKFLIQDRIPGDDSNMRVLTCYSDRNGKVRFAALGHVLLEEHVPTALGNPCCIINEVNEEVVAQATKFLEHIGYTGFSNFDLKYDQRDGKYKFFEINIRLGRSNFYVTGSGFNVTKFIIEDLICENEIPYTIADNTEHIFSIVPKCVIKKYVSDEHAREKALRLIKNHKWSNPLFYNKERNLKHWIFSILAYFNQIKKFKKFYK
ncbi:MAG: D-aspartate ligase [Eubacteriales bacterium SKADARSKE-1]|nr:D-aspartate ligase [Eubacteriales bacterium SKADARSKE-1]